MSGQEPLKMVHSDLVDGDGLIVDFSDGTSAGFTANQLLGLAVERVLTDSDNLRFANERSSDK
jgi:hypothetical protein